jgi:hypothetical protein
VLLHTLDAERVRPREKRVELENRIDPRDERSLTQGFSTMTSGRNTSASSWGVLCEIQAMHSLLQ